MQYEGDTLVSILHKTKSPIKLLDETYSSIASADGCEASVTADQALLMVRCGQFTGGGSLNKVRYIKFTPKAPETMTAAEKAFCAAHDLAQYDPTYFRNFIGNSADQSSFPANRRKVARMK